MDPTANQSQLPAIHPYSSNNVLSAGGHQGWTIWDERLERAVYIHDEQTTEEVTGGVFFRLSDAGEPIGISIASSRTTIVQQSSILHWRLDPNACPFTPSTSTLDSDSNTPRSLVRSVSSSHSAATRPRPILGRSFSNGGDVQRPLIFPVATENKCGGPLLPDPTPWCSFCKRRYPEKEYKWKNHKDIDWTTAEYRCSILRDRAMAKNFPVHCSYCQKAAPEMMNSHWKKCPITKKIMCPKLRQLPPCQKCGAYGDNAHTTAACPERPELENPNWPNV